MILLKLLFLLSQVLCGIDVVDPFLECLVPDLNLACTQQCEEVSLECVMGCGSDTNCISQCLREITDCEHNCPCEKNCLDGCDDCANPICECESNNKQSNTNWNNCLDDNSLSLGRCIYECQNHELCEFQCLEQFKLRQTDCPCEDNCPTGCPCPGYDCIDTTTAPTTVPPTDNPGDGPSPDSEAVLVLGTMYDTNVPFVIDFDGNVNEESVFEIGKDVTISYGCAATLNGEFWYFGGSSNKSRQISKINPDRCQIVRQKDWDLDFNFHQGSCNTFNEPTPTILLCFDTEHSQACHTFDGQNFEAIHLSHFSHQHTHGLANYRGKALTTGCQDDGCSIKTELLDMNTLQWQNGTDYPFSSSRIYRYSTASTADAAYIIGGRYTQDVIAEYKDDQWRKLPPLQQGRQQHTSISFGSDTMIFGGSTSDYKEAKTEFWDLEAETYKDISHTVGNGKYVYGIALYIVPFNFCESFPDRE